MWDFLQGILVQSALGFGLVAVGLWIESRTGLPHFTRHKLTDGNGA